MQSISSIAASQTINPDVLFVGAGPVGLLAAIEAKILAPDVEIAMLEKHAEYQRHHVLIVQEKSLKDCARHPLLDPVIQHIKKTKVIPTSELEDSLLKVAHQLGIRIIHRTVDDPKKLPLEFPKAKIIVGSSGAHGIIRKEIFKDKKREEKDLHYICEIKYRVKGKGAGLNFIETYRALKGIKTIAMEHIGKQSGGSSPISTRFFIDEASYNELVDKKVSFKNPLSLNELDKVPEPLRKNIAYWLANKNRQTGEERIAGSEKITVTKIGVYSSKLFAREKQYGNRKVTWCLVGDEAFGTPFFTSLNNGFESAHELSKAIFRSMNNQEPPFDLKHSINKKKACSGPLDKNFIEYASFLLRQSTLRIAESIAKAVALSAAKAFIYISAIVPWQIIKPHNVQTTG